MREDFDVIIVGAGLAGLACAGELVLQGARPLLVCETQEVGAVVAPTWVQGNRGFTQHATWSVGWGGGWWYPLVRALNIPVTLYPSGTWRATMWGSGEFRDIPLCTSAAAFCDTLAAMSPIPIDSFREELERVIHAGLAIPYPELLNMHEVSVSKWLTDQGAGPIISMMIEELFANIFATSSDDVRAHLSVFGGFGYLRSYWFGEAALVCPYPDPREGLCIPIAQEVERRGGTVWRGRRVDRVVTEGGRVGAVVLADGTEVRAPVVAIATGSARISSLLDPMPPEVAPILAHKGMTGQKDFCTYTVLDKPVVNDHRITVVIGQDGSNLQLTWPLHAMCPWTTEPGKQFVLSAIALSPKKIADVGGEEAVFARIYDINESLYPGFKDAIVESKHDSHKYGWFEEVSFSPKLPRTIPSVDGLWFVGIGSVPIGGMAMEASASAGILGARGILESRK